MPFPCRGKAFFYLTASPPHRHILPDLIFYLKLSYRKPVWLRISNISTGMVNPTLFLCNFTLQERNSYG